MCDLTTEWILESVQSFSVSTYIFFFGNVLWRLWRAENYSFLRMRGNSDARKGACAHRWPSLVRGAVLALPIRSSGERRTHSSEWEGTQTPRRERHAHRWPSMAGLLKVRTPVRIRTGREFNPDPPPLDISSTLVSLRPPCGHTHGRMNQCCSDYRLFCKSLFWLSTEAVAFSPRPHPYLPCFAPLSRERLSLHCSPN